MSMPPPPVAPKWPVTVYVKPHGRKYMATYAFSAKSIRKIITDEQLLDLLGDLHYVVKQ